MCLLSLIIPCYNEAKNLPALIEACHNILQKDIEIILVDNGSTDNSSIIMRKLITKGGQLRFIHIPINKGYGYGIIQGLKQAHGQYIGWTHADLQTDPKDILVALDYIKQTQQTNLFIKGFRKKRAWFDNFFSLGMSLFESFLLKKSLWEINAQPTVFHRSFFQCWENPPSDFSLDLYAYYQAKLQKQTINRFPVYFLPRKHGQSHWNHGFFSVLKQIRRIIFYSLKMKREQKKSSPHKI